jgi:hypothetical protein
MANMSMDRVGLFCQERTYGEWNSCNERKHQQALRNDRHRFLLGTVVNSVNAVLSEVFG